jgi:hypothetical protein
MASEHARIWNRRREWKPPKLTTEQRAEITRRLSDGESPIDLAAEYGVTASRIRQLR